jgi:hypothetical protein
METVPIEPSELNRYLDDSAIDRLRKYFGSGRYTGGRFERFGGGGDRIEAVDQFGSSDIVAVSLLSVRIPGRAALELIEGDEGLNELLAAVPTNSDLWAVAEEVVAPGSPAAQLWTRLAKLPGIKWVTASKLIARKRPRLIPVFDRVVKGALGRPDRDDWWRPLRRVLVSSPHLVDRLEQLRAASEVGPDISLLRILDASIWMKEYGERETLPNEDA